MIRYRVFYRDYKFKKDEPMGVLIERRGRSRGMTQLQSGARWAKLAFGHLVKDKQAIFVVPDKLESGSDTSPEK